MLYLLMIWLVLFPVCLYIGIFVLNFFKTEAFNRASDRYILAVWLGIILLSISNMAISLILPLSPLVGILVAVIWLLIAILNNETYHELTRFFTSITRPMLLQGIGLAIATAAFISQQMIWFDSGLYHLGSINWLRQYGSVTGVALIHSRFGFTSSWFAFSAPLIPDFIGENVGAITNGFVFLITLFWGLISLRHGLTKNSLLADWFAVLFSSIVAFIYLVDNTNGYSVISFSPDTPIALLIGIVTWSILIIANQPDSLNSQIIPLILALGAFSIKPTAAPLILIAIPFYLRKTQRLFCTIALIITLLLPNIVVSIQASGCPLYPSQLFCLNLPWKVSQETIEKEVSVIKNTDQFDTENSQVNPWLKIAKQRYQWLKQSRDVQISFLALIISLALGIYLYVTNKKTQIRWVVILGLLGSSFIIFISPLFRFGLGYFLIIPTIFVANLLLERQIPFNKDQILFKLSFLILTSVLIIRGLPWLSSGWLLPPKLPPVELATAQLNDIEYYYPTTPFVRCWMAKLPCAGLPIRLDLKLRNPNEGIKGGFIWKTQPD